VALQPVVHLLVSWKTDHRFRSVPSKSVASLRQICSNPTICPPSLLSNVTSFTSLSHVVSKLLPLRSPTRCPFDLVPSSLLLSKIIKRAVLKQVPVFLSQNNLLDPNHSIFKSGHSAETALLSDRQRAYRKLGLQHMINPVMILHVLSEMGRQNLQIGPHWPFSKCVRSKTNVCTSLPFSWPSLLEI